MDRLLYNMILHGAGLPMLALYYLPARVLRGKYKRSFWGKLGRLPKQFNPERLPKPRVWFHAVSVGEVSALAPLVEAFRELRPDAAMIVSTGTETGQARARDVLQGVDGLLYLPLDFPWLVKPVVRRISPDLFVLMETELWPNLIRSLKEADTTVVLANGRISDRSFPRYMRFKRLFRSTLEALDLFLMTSEMDRERIVAMGAPPHRVQVTGNTKFDAALGEVPPGVEGEVRELLDIPYGAPVFLAASTHPGEHEIVLDAYAELKEAFPDLLLVIVPRHPDKTPAILEAVRRRGLPQPYLRSMADQGRRRCGAPITIIDSTGELFRTYAIASVVFVGGSLVPRGGQNILEPAAWGKTVLFGPSMEDFREAREILVRCGAGMEVRNRVDLVSLASRLLSDVGKTIDLGRQGREEILTHMGSARRNAQLLVERLDSSHAGDVRQRVTET